MPEPEDAAIRDPLSETTRRYRRNLLAVCFVISVFWFYPEINLGNASLFGISIKGNGSNSGRLIWALILVILAYHLIMFLLYSRTDFKIWSFQIKDRYSPSWLMLFGFSPPKFIRKRIRQLENPNTELLIEEDKNIFTLRFTTYDSQQRKSRSQTSMQTPIRIIKVVRIKFCTFLVVEFGLPILYAVVSVVFAFDKYRAFRMALKATGGH